MNTGVLSRILVSIIYILLGAFILYKPTTAGDSLCYLLAGTLALIGVIEIITFAVTKVEDLIASGSYSLAIGIILLVLAVFVIVQKELVVSLIPFIFGLMIAINGIISIQHAINLKRLQYGSGNATLILAVAIAIFGIVISMFPFKSVETLFLLIGIGLVVSGVFDIIGNLMLAHSVSRIRKKMDGQDVYEEAAPKPAAEIIPQPEPEAEAEAPAEEVVQE